MYFKDKFKPLPIDYNLVLAFLWRHPEKVDLNRVKVVHYCAAGSKPWRYTGVEENMEREHIKLLVKMWWDIYNDESLDLKRPVGAAPVVTEPMVSVEAFKAALSEARPVKYVAAPSAA